MIYNKLRLKKKGYLIKITSKNHTKALIIIYYKFNIQINFCNTGDRASNFMCAHKQ